MHWHEISDEGKSSIAGAFHSLGLGSAPPEAYNVCVLTSENGYGEFRPGFSGL
jgi:hypothetical protein